MTQKELIEVEDRKTNMHIIKLQGTSQQSFLKAGAIVQVAFNLYSHQKASCMRTYIYIHSHTVKYIVRHW